MKKYEEKRIPLYEMKTRREMLLENITWILGGRNLWWEYFVDELTLEFVIRRN